MNIFGIGSETGYAEGTGWVKYSSYRIKKLPFIGLNPGKGYDLPIWQYCYGTTGVIMIPPSFGTASSVTISNSKALSAQWTGNYLIHINALSGLTAPASLLIYASPSTQAPYLPDLDKEIFWVYPNLFMVGTFTSLNDIGHYGIELTGDCPYLPSIGYKSSYTDSAGVTESNLISFGFTSSSQGIKATSLFPYALPYKAKQ